MSTFIADGVTHINHTTAKLSKIELKDKLTNGPTSKPYLVSPYPISHHTLSDEKLSKSIDKITQCKLTPPNIYPHIVKQAPDKTQILVEKLALEHQKVSELASNHHKTLLNMAHILNNDSPNRYFIP